MLTGQELLHQLTAALGGPSGHCGEGAAITSQGGTSSCCRGRFKPRNTGENLLLLLTAGWPGQVTAPRGTWVRLGSRAPSFLLGQPRPHLPSNTNNGWHVIPGNLLKIVTASQTQGEAPRREGGAAAPTPALVPL